MKIVHILKHGVYGNGHVHVAIDLACTQADAGHDVVFATARSSFDELLTSHGVQVAEIPEAGGLRGAGRSGMALLALARQFRPDILHAHMMSSAVLAFAVSKLTGAPLVTTMHNSFDRHSVLMRLGKVVVAVSEAERQLLLSRGYHRDKVRTVLNGAVNSPREAIHIEKEPDQLATPCVVTLCGLHPRKAVHDVISAFAKVHSEHPDWHLNIIGDGPDRRRLESMVTELGLPESVHFVGPSAKPHPLLRQADIFATAALADPFSLAVAEARAAGCAVVATAVGGVPEVLEHGRAGLLTPPSDPAAMAEALTTLMADREALATWQARARTGADHFTVQRMTTDYTAVYESVLSDRRRRWLLNQR